MINGGPSRHSYFTRVAWGNGDNGSGKSKMLVGTGALTTSNVADIATARAAAQPFNPSNL